MFFQKSTTKMWGIAYNNKSVIILKQWSFDKLYIHFDQRDATKTVFVLQKNGINPDDFKTIIQDSLYLSIYPILSCLFSKELMTI